MGIKINVKTRFVVNGREYGSLHEMPEDVRQACGKDPDQAAISFAVNGSFVFNGQKYRSPEEMPEEIRRLYETAMKAVAAGRTVPGAGASSPQTDAAPLPRSSAAHSPRTTTVSDPSWLKWLNVGVVVAAVLALIYYVVCIR